MKARGRARMGRKGKRAGGLKGAEAKFRLLTDPPYLSHLLCSFCIGSFITTTSNLCKFILLREAEYLLWIIHQLKTMKRVIHH